MGLGVIGIGAALAELQPDVLVLLGDRFEILAAAAAAVVARVPIAHLHGGESSEGAFDDAIRHAVTKLAHFHFVAAEPYWHRVVQMGEAPSRVFVVGGLGLDGIKRLPLLGRAALERELGIRFRRRFLMLTYHPVTREPGTGERDLGELLAALDALADTTLVFTMPNADTERGGIAEMIAAFVAGRDHAFVFDSLGHQKYLSCVALADAVVGNSSSGLIEAPSLGCATINIGSRQDGRLRAASVIDCDADRDAIGAALQRISDPAFRASLAGVRNPYGDGGASEKIVAALATLPLADAVKKPFVDLPIELKPA
jgi:UDP-hydrolysing UDP-N-acetyl-D-glucosamine 2-epimerase